MNPSIHVSPTLKLLSPNSLFPEPALQGSFQISCSINDQDTTYGFGDVELYYSETLGTANEVKVGNASGLLTGLGGTPTASADLLIQGNLGGARLRPKLAGAYCHHDQQNSPLVDAWGQDIVVPPQISVVAAYNPNRLNDPPVVVSPIGIDVIPDVPVGQPLVMLLNINAHPQGGSEFVVLHYENSGVSYTQVLYDIEKDYKPDLEKITPTVVGDANIKVWAELRPTQTKSNVLQFHVVPDPHAGESSSSSSSGASSTGGASGGTGGTTAGVGTSGGGPKPPGGCSSADGLELAALLAAAALAARRRRS